MDISSVSNAYRYPQVQPTVQPSEADKANEAKKAGNDRDRDTEDKAAKAVNATPAPTVNLAGQKIGQIINTTA